ncbi:MAG: hypothetical protein FJ146_11315 [Deltaproteobacteria bacterium]|nr:hypothetical protein [Deltaproteobacteria bacterium]
MLSRFTRVLALPILMAATLQSTAALALIDAQGMVGRRWYKLGTDPATKVSSQEIAVAAHLSPIPLVPVSFGARVAAGTLDTTQLKGIYGASSIDAGAVMEAGLDVMAWIPLVPIITPYVRLNIPVYGTWLVKGKLIDTSLLSVPFERAAKVSGTQLSVGAKYSVLPLISVLFEANYGKESWKSTSVKVNNVTIDDDSKTYTLDSQAVLLGVEVGL